MGSEIRQSVAGLGSSQVAEPPRMLRLGEGPTGGGQRLSIGKQTMKGSPLTRNAIIFITSIIKERSNFGISCGLSAMMMESGFLACGASTPQIIHTCIQRPPTGLTSHSLPTVGTGYGVGARAISGFPERKANYEARVKGALMDAQNYTSLGDSVTCYSTARCRWCASAVRSQTFIMPSLLSGFCLTAPFSTPNLQVGRLLPAKSKICRAKY